MAAGSWRSLDWPSWRAWFETIGRPLQRIANSALAQRLKLIRWGLLVVGGLVLSVTASVLWRALLMGAAGAGLALILQELVDPSPLFWAVPWEAVEFVLSRKVRVNHFWLHRTQELARDSVGSSAKVNGFATREGFVLMGAGLNEAQIQWASEFAWRMMYQQPSAKGAPRGCKTTRFLFALWLIAGGLLLLSVWRGVDLASALLLSAVCGAAGHGLAGPAEKFLGPWAERIACRDDKMRPNRLEVGSFEIPQFLWFKGGQGFQVRRVAREETSEGART